MSQPSNAFSRDVHMEARELILIEDMIRNAAAANGYGKHFTKVTKRDVSGLERSTPTVRLPDGSGLQMLVVIDEDNPTPVPPLKFTSYGHIILVALTPESMEMIDKIVDWINCIYFDSSRIPMFPSPLPAADRLTSYPNAAA